MKSFFTTNHVHLKIYGLQNLPATRRDIPRSNEENLAQMSRSPRLLEHTSRQRRSSGDTKLVFPGRVLPSWVLPLLVKPGEKSLHWFPLTCKCHGCVTCFATSLMEKTREKKERAMLVLTCLQIHFVHPAACPHLQEDVCAGRDSPCGSANVLVSSLLRV